MRSCAAESAAGERPRIHPGFRQLPAPTVVVGPHRSGTSVTAAMLVELGVYMGAEARQAAESEQATNRDGQGLAELHEAREFYLLNERLLRRAGAAWNRIEPFLAVRDEPAFRSRSVRMLQWATFGSLRSGYLARLSESRRTAWGWKDPRSSLTLPLWLRLFPAARVVLVTRDSDAVADSLFRRARDLQGSPAVRLPLRVRASHVLENPEALQRLARKLTDRKASPPPPEPCLDRVYCQRLAARYAAEAERVTALASEALVVPYEELTTDPAGVARALAEFTGGDAPADAVARAAGLVRPARVVTR